LHARPAPPSEISVMLKMDNGVYIMGERIRCVVTIENASADSIDVGRKGSRDSLLIELFRASDRNQFDKQSTRPFTAPFLIHSGEGQRLEAFLGDHYAFTDESRYLARAVLVHGAMRYESAFKSFDVVPGMRLASAMQMFRSRPGLERHFEVVFTPRANSEHAFLKITDSGNASRRWPTADLGTILRVAPPKISVMPSGEIVVLHRSTQDEFIRTVFWSMPDAFEFHEHESMLDPDVAGAERVKALYMESGEVEKAVKPWWKIW
ncbi:MAG: hypothetical protein IJ802_04010, partial [Kiritimatiellae bacterium]|nr:hypothetical protein [Kiritimatiellia bacterium]